MATPPAAWHLPAVCRGFMGPGNPVRILADGVGSASANAVTRSEILILRAQQRAVIEQIAEAQALVQRLMAERSIIEAELRGYECAARRRRRENRRKKP